LIIRGFLLGDAPFFPGRVSIASHEGRVWFLADTGATRTLLLDHDAQALGLTMSELEPASLHLTGIGGSVRPFVAREADVQFTSTESIEVPWRQDLLVVRPNAAEVTPGEVACIRRLPSLLGRDFLRRFRFVCDCRSGEVLLER